MGRPIVVLLVLGLLVSSGCGRRRVVYESAHGGAAVQRAPQANRQPLSPRDLERACDQGDADGCASLAQLHLEGRGVQLSVPRAAELSRRACDSGSAEGCTVLGLIYVGRGQGGAGHAREAVTFLRQGCSGGSARGCTALGAMYAAGRGVPEDQQQAQQLWRQACDGGEQAACRRLR